MVALSVEMEGGLKSNLRWSSLKEEVNQYVKISGGLVYKDGRWSSLLCIDQSDHLAFYIIES